MNTQQTRDVVSVLGRWPSVGSTGDGVSCLLGAGLYVLFCTLHTFFSTKPGFVFLFNL